MGVNVSAPTFLPDNGERVTLTNVMLLECYIKTSIGFLQQ